MAYIILSQQEVSIFVLRKNDTEKKEYRLTGRINDGIYFIFLCK